MDSRGSNGGSKPFVNRNDSGELNDKKSKRRRQLKAIELLKHKKLEKKPTKEEAKYKESSNCVDSCAKCSNYSPPDGCYKVSGIVSPKGSCVYHSSNGKFKIIK